MARIQSDTDVRNTMASIEEPERRQIETRAELIRKAALRSTDEYLLELVAKVGEPTAEQTARAETITTRILTKIRPDTPR
jgi:hypothetical protein